MEITNYPPLHSTFLPYSRDILAPGEVGKKVSEKVPEVAGSNPYATGRREGSSGGRESERERGSAGGFCPHPLAIAKLLASSAAYEDRFGGGSLPSPVRGLITAAVAAESLFFSLSLSHSRTRLRLDCRRARKSLGSLGKKLGLRVSCGWPRCRGRCCKKKKKKNNKNHYHLHHRHHRNHRGRAAGAPLRRRRRRRGACFRRRGCGVVRRRNLLPCGAPG